MVQEDLQDLYAAVWDGPEGPARDARYRMAAAELEAALKERSREGYRLRSLFGYEGDGQDWYAAVWEQAGGPDRPAQFRMTPEDLKAALARRKEDGFRPRLVSGYAVGGQELYAAVWEQDDSTAWEARYHLTAEEYQSALDELVERG
jgi:hypothetical protein